jgi:adenylate kinase
VPQALALEKMMDEGNRQLYAVINFSIDRDELIARLSGRRFCQICGRTFHLLFARPARDEICDRCGEKLYQREDDKEATIVKRLKVYKDQTRPLIDYYSNKGLLKDIDGSGEVKLVLDRIVTALGMNGN